ncbi:competence type IV pilus minor pilin ComGD [Pediococcus siamensis]|uniref:competence type IV pilus minor pilin ComGD n=1 Tax=Pediococcus siamensis TaxID=381829 RepID=UPI00399F1C37
MRLKSGFTLLESLIVLAMVGLLLTSGNLVLKNALSYQREKEFWENFDTEWKKYEQFANFENTVTYISFNKTQEKISFNPLKASNKANYVLKLPPTLHLLSSQEVKIGNNGYVKPQSIGFHSDRDQHTYRITIQLGWGVYHVKKE